MKNRVQREPYLELQAMLLVVALAAYWWYSLQYVGGHTFRPVLTTLVVFGAFIQGRRLGPARVVGKEPIFAFLGAVALIAMPVAGGPAPRGHGFAAAALGSFIAQGAWALHRYPFRPGISGKHFLRKALVARTLAAAGVGLGMAVLLSLYVAVIFVIAALGSEDAGPRALLKDFVLVVLSYFAAGALGGAVIGALAPLIRLPLGALLLGIPLTGAIYGSVGVAMSHMEVLSAPNGSPDISPIEGLVVLTFIGPMWGIMAKDWIEKA